VGGIRAALGNEGQSSTTTVSAVNRRGRSFQCDVRTLPLVDRSQRSYGVILLMSGSDGPPHGDGSAPAQRDPRDAQAARAGDDGETNRGGSQPS
jgi:hypothetical protein